MGQRLDARCRSLVRGYGRAALPNPVVVPDELVEAQARRATKLVDYFRSRGVVVLPDPVGTGKTVVALCCAAILLRLGRISRVLVVAPNNEVAKQWLERAEQLDRGAGSDRPFAVMRRGGDWTLRWRKGELRVITRNLLSDTARPKDDDSLVIVDEAHRGLQRAGRFYEQLQPWAAAQRTLLVSATPFQLSTQGVLTMLEVSGDQRLRRTRGKIEAYGKAVLQLVRYCASQRRKGESSRELIKDDRARALAQKVKEAVESAKASLELFVLRPDPMMEKLPHHPKLGPLRETPHDGIQPGLTSCKGDAAIAHHVARTIPEILNVGKGDMFNRELVSSAEAFWASKAGRCLLERPGDQLAAAKVDAAAVARLASELERALGSGSDHPKVAATVAWVSRKVRQRRHVLVFCVFEATRDALKAALQQNLGESRVSAPDGSKIPREVKTAFRKQPTSSSDAIVLVLQDRFSESIDLDGGHPCLVHNDLPWNPARLSQRWGRAVRASSNFVPIAPEDIFVPVLDTEVDRRLYETVRGRWEIGDLLLPKRSGYDEDDDGSGGIPPELMREVAEAWAAK